MSDYAAFATRLLATGIIPDPYTDGEPRFRQEPLVLDKARADAIRAAAVAMVECIEAAYRAVLDDPQLLDDFLVLTPVQKLMFQASAPWWHGIARADVFETEDGRIQVCELNSDTPTGQPEVTVSAALAHEDHPELHNPSARLGEATAACMRAYAKQALQPGTEQIVGLLYPTEVTEDIHMIQLMHHWFEQAGWSVVLGSPFHLDRQEDGRVTLRGQTVTVVFRHYKTDWWSERLPVWADAEPFEDPLPLSRELDLLLAAQNDGQCVVVNPFGAIVSQNKRLMALLWERPDLFEPRIQELVQTYLPETIRLDAMHPQQVVAEKERWVLKSDYGAEGEEVFIGRHTTDAEWSRLLEQALPERFVVQQYFEPARGTLGTINFGPFIVAGRPAGLFGRVQPGATDHGAITVPILIEAT